ncbi:MAG: EI24 domain-containing protein [Mariprofundaceae bacterium]|nr:EI24 domain-containing protein [Mariprofundaceae bacterium]
MLKGAWALVKGFHLLLSRQELRSMLWRMLLLLLVLFVGLTYGVFELSAWIVDLFRPKGDAWYVDSMVWILRLFAMLFALGVGIVCFVMLGSVAAAPWLDELYVRVAKLKGIALEQSAQPWWKSAGRSLWSSVMPLAGFIPWALLAGLLLLVPVYGTVVASLVWGVSSLRLLSYEFMDTPASFKAWKWAERKQQFEENGWFYLGFSGLAMFLLIIPGLNLFVLPAAVVGLFPRINAGVAATPETSA